MAKARFQGGFRRVGSGHHAGKIAIKVYMCRGCGKDYKGKKPGQCECGRMDFSRADSMGEAGRYRALQLMEATGKISNLRFQVPFSLYAAKDYNGQIVPIEVGKYVADFVYDRDGKEVVEDWKGVITDVANLKLRWMAAMGMPVKLTGAK